MNKKVLLIDDDAHLLGALERNLRVGYQVTTATSGALGLQKMAADGPFAVVVADMQMPEMDGIQLLREIQKRHPETVRMMLTGNADQDTAIEAVNQGHIFQFLTKPCRHQTLTTALQAGLRQYALITAERDLLEKTLNGSIKILMDILALADPVAFGRGKILQQYVRAYLNHQTMPDCWEFEMAAMLSPLGRITIPGSLLEKARQGRELTAEEQAALEAMPKNTSDLVANIPRLEGVARILCYQAKHFDGSGPPRYPVAGEDIPTGARILKVLNDLLDLEDLKLTKAEALSQMQQRPGWYDPRVLDLVFSCFAVALPADSVKTQGQATTVRELQPGQLVLADIVTECGKTLVLARSRITPVLLHRLANFSRCYTVREPVYVEPQAAPTDPAKV